MAVMKNNAGLEYPITKMNFVVSVGGSQGTLCFSEVTGLDASVDVIEFRQGNAHTAGLNKLPGLVHHGNITLKMGMTITTSDEILTWFQDCVSENRKALVRKDVTIELIDSNEPVASSGPIAKGNLVWKLENAWCCKYTAPDLDAKGNDVAILSVELAFENLKMPGQA